MAPLYEHSAARCSVMQAPHCFCTSRSPLTWLPTLSPPLKEVRPHHSWVLSHSIWCTSAFWNARAYCAGHIICWVSEFIFIKTFRWCLHSLYTWLKDLPFLNGFRTGWGVISGAHGVCFPKWWVSVLRSSIGSCYELFTSPWWCHPDSCSNLPWLCYLKLYASILALEIQKCAHSSPSYLANDNSLEPPNLDPHIWVHIGLFTEQRSVLSLTLHCVSSTPHGECRS